MESIFLIVAQFVWDLCRANLEGAKHWCKDKPQEAKGGSGDGAD